MLLSGLNSVICIIDLYSWLQLRFRLEIICSRKILLGFSAYGFKGVEGTKSTMANFVFTGKLSVSFWERSSALLVLE